MGRFLALLILSYLPAQAPPADCTPIPFDDTQDWAYESGAWITDFGDATIGYSLYEDSLIYESIACAESSPTY